MKSLMINVLLSGHCQVKLMVELSNSNKQVILHIVQMRENRFTLSNRPTPRSRRKRRRQEQPTDVL